MKKITVALFCMLLMGCFDQGIHDKDWYMENEVAMLEKIEECKNNSEFKFSQDCKNAIDAMNELSNAKLKLDPYE